MSELENSAYETLRATITSGLRTVWCYTAGRRVASWSPFELDMSVRPWMMPTFKDLAAKAPFGNGRVLLGFAWDGLAEPAETLKVRLTEVRSAGSHLITSHASSEGPMFGNPLSGVQVLHDRSLLGPDILFSHSNSFTARDAEPLALSGAHTSSTPYTELQMGMGHAIAFREDQFPHASIGIDCHSASTAYIPAQAALLLQHARNEHHVALRQKNEWTRSLPLDKPLSVEDAFNLCTVKGARAAGLADQIGRLKAGFKADILIFDALNPALFACSDPIGAIVLHSNPGCIDTVLVDGTIRKREWILQNVVVAERLDGKEGEMIGGTELSWSDVATKTLESRDQIWQELQIINQREAEDGLIKAMRLGTDNMIDPRINK